MFLLHAIFRFSTGGAFVVLVNGLGDFGRDGAMCEIASNCCRYSALLVSLVDVCSIFVTNRGLAQISPCVARGVILFFAVSGSWDLFNSRRHLVGAKPWASIFCSKPLAPYRRTGVSIFDIMRVRALHLIFPMLSFVR